MCIRDRQEAVDDLERRGCLDHAVPETAAPHVQLTERQQFFAIHGSASLQRYDGVRPGPVAADIASMYADHEKTVRF
ncbi:MAG: hypothetical protein EBR28_14670 [Planctomycetia bacterium]|nr:hypothetical protein [Planctomycetia bacterium]